jgi:hypothetical protein
MTNTATTVVTGFLYRRDFLLRPVEKLIAFVLNRPFSAC